jgi:serine/threonine protein phosphatase PrpC
MLNGCPLVGKRVESGYPAQITPDGYLKPKDKYFSGFEVAMTRALGHKVLGAFGLTFEPQVRRLKLSKRDAVLVIASDGLWEKLTDREVVNICRETEDKTKVAESLLKAVRI